MSDLLGNLRNKITNERDEKLVRRREAGNPYIQHYIEAKQRIASELVNLNFYREARQSELQWFERLFGVSRREFVVHNISESGTDIEDIIRRGNGELELLVESDGFNSRLTLSCSSNNWRLWPCGRSVEETVEQFFRPMVEYSMNHWYDQPRSPAKHF